MVYFQAKPNSCVGLRPIYFGVDLKSPAVFVGSFPRLTILGISDESWQDAFCSIDGNCSLEQLRTHRDSLLGRCSRVGIAQHRALSHHGLRAAHVARVSARYRSHTRCPCYQALWDGIASSGATLHPGRCQRAARLAHLGRLGSSLDWPCQQTLCRRTARTRCQHCGESLCPGFEHHRLVTPRWEMSMCSTFCPCKREPSTSWTGAMSVSRGCMQCIRRVLSLSLARNPISMPDVCIRTRWKKRRAWCAIRPWRSTAARAHATIPSICVGCDSKIEKPARP